MAIIIESICAVKNEELGLLEIGYTHKIILEIKNDYPKIMRIKNNQQNFRDIKSPKF